MKKNNMLNIEYSVIEHLYRAKKPLKIGKIAKDLKLPHSTIGSCVKRLEERRYVRYDRYNPVYLSERGRELAIELIRHAQLLEILLHKSLGLTVEEANAESRKFNLLFSCNIINRICEKYNHPKNCPCGEEIVNTKGCYCNNEYHTKLMK